MGQRLDRVLCRHLDLSRRQVRQLVEGGLVRVNQRRLDHSGKGRRVAVGDRIGILPFARPEQQRPKPDADLKLDTLSTGPGWLMVNKPANLAVHPLRPDEFRTVLNAVFARHCEIFGVGEGGLRSGVVHRLDVGTSGALLFALSPQCWQAFRAAFREHRTVKIYQAVVHGRLEAPDQVSLPLAVTRHKPALVRVKSGGRLCTLRYRPVEVFPDATCIEIQLLTGFLHQIRAMMAYVGHPLLGDTRYGGPAIGLNRPMMHARSLTCEQAHGTCEPPADFRCAVEGLREVTR